MVVTMIDFPLILDNSHKQAAAPVKSQQSLEMQGEMKERKVIFEMREALTNRNRQEKFPFRREEKKLQLRL